MVVVKVNKMMVLTISVLLLLTYLVFYRSDEMLQSKSLKAASDRLKQSGKITQSIVSHEEIPQSKLNLMRFPTKFIISKDYELALLRYDGFMLQELNKNHKNILSNAFKAVNGTPTFSTCRCGRVSDPCICCTKLLPFPFPGTTLQTKMYKPIIISGNDTRSPTFCFDVNYKPLKDIVIVNGFLVNIATNCTLENLIQTVESIDKKEKIDIYSGSQISPHEISELCGIQGPYSLCLTLHDLDYKVSSESAVKTSFVGCATITINRNDKIISLFNVGCFKAHKGASADGELKVQIKPDVKAPVMAINSSANSSKEKKDENDNKVQKVKAKEKEVVKSKKSLVLPVAEQDVHRGGM